MGGRKGKVMVPPVVARRGSPLAWEREIGGTGEGVNRWERLGREFGVHPVQVGTWKKELQEQASSLFETKRGPKPVEPAADPERLYTEIGRLKVELDWLKKKSGLSL